jgi:hypothetical protein
MIEADKVQIPVDKYIMMFKYVGILLAFVFVKGGSGMKSIIGIAPCGISYQLTDFLMLAVFVYLMILDCRKIILENI